MLELGEAAGAAHREAGRRVAEIRASKLFALGVHAQEVKEGALAAGMAASQISLVKDAEEMAAKIFATIRTADLVYIKGSRRMGLEKAVEALAALLGGEPAR
jgi:UDP-N-acetylmuramyl pentapeptide synthase